MEAATANSQIVSQFSDVVNRGDFEQLIVAGDGADTVVQLVQGFRDLGTARFETRLGTGADSYIAAANDIYVGPDATCHAR